jgi:nitrate reductase NapE component
MDLFALSTMLLLWSLLALASFIFLVIALVDVLRSDFRGQYDKIIWVLVILFLPPFLLGPLLYFLVGRAQKKGKTANLGLSSL